MATLYSSKKFTVLSIAVLALIALIFATMVIFFNRPKQPSPPPGDALYRQSSASIEQRVENLLSYMTLKEKVGQMALVEKNSIREPNDVSLYGLGGILSGFGGKPEHNTAVGWSSMVANFVNESRTSRLGIPILYGIDAIHGHSNVPEATVFPHFIGLGATGDEALVEAVARATAEELLATGIRWSYSPTLDVPKDIRWGRTYEAFSDDPALVATLGSAYVRGTQRREVSSEADPLTVLSTPKHFIGNGAMVWGSSSNENFSIDQGTTVVDEGALRTEYLPPFISAIDAGALSVMVGLNSWGPQKLASNTALVTDILKGELGFAGFVVSDWYGVYEIEGSDYQAGVIAINAGVDMVMLPFDYEDFVENITWAVKRGEISEARIDDAVRRILRAKFALGLFDTVEDKPPFSVIGSAEHRALAKLAVAKSLVLLKNDDAVLPLKETVKHIQVAGSSANNIGRQAGAWTVEWQGLDGNWLPGATSILEGIRNRANSDVLIEFDERGQFADKATIADIGIAVVGEKPYAEGWGDKEYPTLEAEDLETIKRLQTTSKRVIVIIISGRPLLVTNEIDTWDAVVAGWLPGSEGAGVADVLFGHTPFSGTLPLPWPHHSEQLPIGVDGTTADDTPLLFPRYYGLTYLSS